MTHQVLTTTAIGVLELITAPMVTALRKLRHQVVITEVVSLDLVTTQRVITPAATTPAATTPAACQVLTTPAIKALELITELMVTALRKLRLQEVITEAVMPVLDTTQLATTPAVCQVLTMGT
jgi:hypothetical protein